MSRFVAIACMLFAVTTTLLAAEPPKVGQPAPAFTLSDADGKPVSLSDYADKVVVLEWINPNCPFVQRQYKQGAMKSLAEKYGSSGVVWLAVNSTSNAAADQNQQWIKQYSLPYPILMDSTGEVGKAYGAKTTPHMFIINKGTLVYRGAIDDDPSGDKGQKTNYVGKALDEIAAGNSVSAAETKSYGCSVKYAR